MNSKVCIRDNCSRRAEKRGLCGTDYWRYRTSPDFQKLPKPSLEERFWMKVEKTDSCWLWQGAHSGPIGHGNFRTGHKTMPAHRFAYELIIGPIPAGMEVCHNCPGGDNPACVNPSHMFIGTHADNMRDASHKGRLTGAAQRDQWGEANKMAKLTTDQVVAIRSDRTAGATYKQLSQKYGVAFMTIAHIIKGRTWAHLTTAGGGS